MGRINNIFKTLQAKTHLYFMKNKILFFCCVSIFFSATLHAQSTQKIKLYAYSQPMLSGIQKNVMIDESGNEYKADTKSKLNYLIYLEHRPSKTVRPIEIWIDGKGYSLKIEEVEFTPVDILDNTKQTKKIILVPATTNKVFHLSLNGLSTISHPKAKELQDQKPNEITLVYKRKCRRTHVLKSMILPLPAIPMM